MIDPAIYDGLQTELSIATKELAGMLKVHEEAQSAYDVANDRVIFIQSAIKQLEELPEIKAKLGTNGATHTTFSLGVIS